MVDPNSVTSAAGGRGLRQLEMDYNYLRARRARERHAYRISPRRYPRASGGDREAAGPAQGAVRVIRRGPHFYYAPCPLCCHLISHLTAATALGQQQEALRTQVATLTSQVQASDERKREVEKEQEDLLVLLDELNSKRRKDKERMRTAGMDVSEDEADDDDDDDEDEE